MFIKSNIKFLPKRMRPFEVSVALATHNGAQYLDAQLSSIANQTRLPDQVVISDDMSTDATIDIACRFADNAPFPVTVLHQMTRLGYGKNFSAAVRACTGNIIFFCDQDDYWLPGKIEEITRYFIDMPSVDLITHNINICDADLSPNIENYFQYLIANKLPKTTMMKGCATAIRRELADHAFPLPNNGYWTHDNRVHALAHTSNRFMYIDDILMNHRIHDTNASGWIIEPKCSTGIIMAWLDLLAAKHCDVYASVIKYFPTIARIDATVEFIQACSNYMCSVGKTWDPRLLRLRVKSRNVIDSAKNISNMWVSWAVLCSALLGGHYHKNGGLFSFIADILRATTSRRRLQE